MLNGRSEAIVAATSVFLALSLVTVCLRCFVRARVVRAFGLDDWTMVAGRRRGGGAAGQRRGQAAGTRSVRTGPQ
ncbi:hypothetical protein KXX61_003147, partial [Aspergillus fumigatus]